MASGGLKKRQVKLGETWQRPAGVGSSSTAKADLAVRALLGDLLLPPDVPPLHPGALVPGHGRVMIHQARLHLEVTHLLGHANGLVHNLLQAQLLGPTLCA